MIERDYIMRMVREIGQMLARVISKRAAEEYEEAAKDLDGICQGQVGLDLGLVRSIAPDELLSILQQGGGLYVGRCLTLAEVLLEDASIREDTGRAVETVVNYVHAYRLIREAMEAADEEGREELVQKLAVIGARLGELGVDAGALG